MPICPACARNVAASGRFCPECGVPWPKSTPSPSDEIKVGPVAVRFLIEGVSTGGSIAIFEFDVPADARVPVAHSHDAYEETIYGLAGILTWTVDGRKQEVGRGQVLHIPRGAVHRFDNSHSDDATMLAVVTPGVLGPRFFREMADVLSTSAGGPPNLAAMADVMRRHGLTPAP